MNHLEGKQFLQALKDIQVMKLELIGLSDEIAALALALEGLCDTIEAEKFSPPEVKKRGRPRTNGH
jgi:hypothetical protein